MKTNKKLRLNKETIARINNDQKSSILGGAIETDGCDWKSIREACESDLCPPSDRLCSNTPCPSNGCGVSLDCAVVPPIKTIICLTIPNCIN